MDLEQLEALAFSEDRDAALAQLLPGSADHDYYRCVHLQQRGLLDQAQLVIDDWTNRHNDSRRDILLMRQRLLRLSNRFEQRDRDDARDAFGAYHWHEPEAAPGSTRLPSVLPAPVDGAAVLAEAVRYSSDLQQVTEEGLYELLDGSYDLDEARRRRLIDRLSHTPSARLVPLIAGELGPRELGKFGSLSAHRALTLAQLGELVQLRRELGTHKEWVTMVIQRMRPPAHVPFERHGAARLAYLTELWSFVSQLVETFSSLKLHVLWHLLDEGRRQQPPVRDRALFLTYLKLPRHAPFLFDGPLRKRSGEEIGQLGADFRSCTGLPPARDDEGLVRDFLSFFLADGGDSHDLEPLLERTWFELELAKIRLLGGAPDAERWTRTLGPAAAQALLEQVEITLGHDNVEELGEADEVLLRLDIKNVPQLFVKVFRIDPVTYFAIHGREVGPDIDLDGLAASHEEVLSFPLPPIRRVRHVLALPQCQRAGCYVIDLIGNGKSSRALIWKGRLRYARRLSAAGQLVTVFDQAGGVRPKARLWMGGREFLPDDEGLIAVPFSTANGQGNPPILLVDGDLATATTLPQVQEHYALYAQAHVEREALSASRTARAVVHLEVWAAGAPAPIGLLQQATWELVLTDRAGATTQRTSPLVLDDRSCALLEWQMPDDVAAAELHLRGKVEVLSEQREQELHVVLRADLAEMHSGAFTDALYLAQTDRGYVLSALGKSGEPKRGERIPMWFVHRWARNQQGVSLDTDERGRIELGPLAGVESLQASAGPMHQGWQLVGRRVGGVLHCVAGEEVRIPPPPGLAAEELLAGASLVELRGGMPSQHANAALRVVGRTLGIAGLAPGEYQLRVPMMDLWSLIVLPAASPRFGEHAATPTETYRLLPAPSLIERVEVTDEALVVKVSGARPSTRVHVVATRFVPSPAMGTLETGRRYGTRLRDARPGAHYQSGRDLGDEYRYVLERRQAARRPGVMLEKPSLLLNPWARKTTTTAVAKPSIGGAFGGAQAPRAQAAPPQSGGGGGGSQSEGFATFDFVPGDAVVLANLRPDGDGVVRIDRAKLGEHSAVQLYCSDDQQTTLTRVSLPEQPLVPRDQRLMRALPPDAHITQRRQIDPCRAGETVIVQDAATAKIHIVDTVERAHSYLLSLGADTTLREFEFVTRWHKLGEAERSEKYSKHACHELNLFLYFRDRTYFNRVITPYLAQKRVQTFVDRWLLGADLTGFLEPRELRRLNAVERALLALRLPQKDELARILTDEVALLPPDPEREAHIVEVMLAGAALDDDSSGLQDMKKRMKEEAAPAMEMDDLPSTRMLAAESDLDDRAFDESPRSRPTPSARAPGAMVSRSMAAAPSAAAPMAMMSAPAMPPPSPKRAKQVREESEEEGGPSADKARGGGGAELRRRESMRQLFRPADKTQEWAEQNWWRRRPEDNQAHMIAANRYWRDLAMHRDGPFLSSALGLAMNSFAEAMCALAVLDLPFEAPAHRIDNDGATLTIVASSHALVASSQLVAAELTVDLPLIVGQTYLRNDDRHQLVEGEYVQKFVTGPLVAGVIYATQVVVANPTGTQQRVSVLVQIPRGSVPTNASRPTRTYDVVLRPYAAHGIEVCFYFPRAGGTSHFGAHVSKRGQLIAAAPGVALQVVPASEAVDTNSWGHISQHGTLEQVLAVLRSHNLGALDLGRTAWRMRDAASYQAILEVLEQRLAFDPVLWSYALWHGDRPRIRRWLRANDRLAEAGPVIDAALVELDAEQMEIYEHLEFAPLINARAHRLGAKTKILNDGFAAQLRSFLQLVAHRKAPTIDDQLVAAHYLFAQDRFDEARAAMERAEAADAAGHRSRMQLDYLRAYGACAAGELEVARAIARRWLDQPVDRWRKRFAALAAMLDEAAGGAAVVSDVRSREQVQSNLARAQPSFELTVDAGGVELASQHLSSIELRYFAMDIELLFSRQPFVQADVSRFSYIEPGYRQVVRPGEAVGEAVKGAVGAAQAAPGASPEPGAAPVRVPWPEAMRGKNVVVEAVSAGLRKAKVHYAHDLTVVTAHQYGQVRVQRASTRTAVPAAYVKVYARRHDGEVAFFKDGYTDVRGWFDYASLSTDELDHTARFSILVHADSLGATIVEADPPPR